MYVFFHFTNVVDYLLHFIYCGIDFHDIIGREAPMGFIRQHLCLCEIVFSPHFYEIVVEVIIIYHVFKHVVWGKQLHAPYVRFLPQDILYYFIQRIYAVDRAAIRLKCICPPPFVGDISRFKTLVSLSAIHYSLKLL